MLRQVGGAQGGAQSSAEHLLWGANCEANIRCGAQIAFRTS